MDYEKMYIKTFIYKPYCYQIFIKLVLSKVITKIVTCYI